MTFRSRAAYVSFFQGMVVPRHGGSDSAAQFLYTMSHEHSKYPSKPLDLGQPRRRDDLGGRGFCRGLAAIPGSGAQRIVGGNGIVDGMAGWWAAAGLENFGTWRRILGRFRRAGTHLHHGSARLR